MTTVFSSFLSAYFITHYLDDSLKTRMKRIAGVISKSSYVLNPAILANLKGVINAEIVLFDQNGRVLKSTFSNPDSKERIKKILFQYPNKPFSEKDIRFGNARYRTIVHPLPLPEQGRAYLSLWIPTHEAHRLRTKIILGMGIIALFGILAMTVAGYVIARTITAPLEELVRVTGRVSGGDLNERARLDSGDEIGSLATSFNHMIDQLRTFEQKLVESEKLATAGQMAAGLAHEIRNPLTSIKMFGQVLHNRLIGRPKDRKVLSSLVNEIDRLDRIIQEIINRARPGELQKQWGDPNRQVKEVITIARESLSTQKIHIEQKLAEHPPQIHADHEKIKQVLWNLILNAKEAMPKGGRLILNTGITDNQFLKISIEDSGQGIPEGEVETLFQPFFTTKPEGVGLGLTMSRKIIKQHGGKLILENRPGGGTRATIVLPIKSGQHS